jgi:non-homologous end joining protein Ku
VAARAIWKGVLKIGTNKVPVKLYSAVQDRSVHFHILDTSTKQPIKQRMVDPENDREIPKEEIQRGLEVEPGTFVVIDEEELTKLEPKASRDIEIRRFVPPARINHQWYERPYYVGPDGDESAYFALAKALQSAYLPADLNSRNRTAARLACAAERMQRLDCARLQLSAKRLKAPLPTCSSQTKQLRTCRLSV